MIARGATAVALLALTIAAWPATAETIFIAGDSTAAELPADRYPEMGWGVMLPCGLSPEIAVRNLAKGGRSTRTFQEEGRFDALLKEMKAGDTVLIQFGHNDASKNKPERYAPAETMYRDHLTRFVRQVRAGGGTPVLLTPVARREFDDRGRARASFPEYSSVVRDVAAATRTPLIDLEARSVAWVQSLGPENSKRYFLHLRPEDGFASAPTGKTDDTHFQELGARRVADIVAGKLRRLKLPVSAKVLARRPDLTRAAPLGKGVCR